MENGKDQTRRCNRDVAYVGQQKDQSVEPDEQGSRLVYHQAAYRTRPSRGIGVVITDKHVVRFHSPETEQSVLKVDSQKFVTRDITQSRWRPAPPNSMFDAMAMRIFEQDRERVGGISDRRYQVHAASLGTLILELAGLRDRPNLDDTPTSPESPTTTDGHCTPEASKTQSDRNAERSTNGPAILASGDGLKDGRTQDDSDRSKGKAP